MLGKRNFVELHKIAVCVQNSVAFSAKVLYYGCINGRDSKGTVSGDSSQGVVL